MAGRRPSPIHLGGPLGLAGLTVLAGAAGLMVIAGNEETPPGPASPVSGVEARVEIETVDTTLPDPGGKDTSDPVETVATRTNEQIVIAEKPAKVDPPVIKTLPASGPETVTLPAAAKGAEVTYIVRIKGAPEVDTIARNFKRDPEAANKAYEELCARLPALKDFKLVGASYSGEIKLAYQLDPGVQPSRAVMNDIKDKIMAIEGVAYADPDYVAHPGEDRK